MLYIMRSGLRLDEVEWVELTESNNEFRALQLDSVKSGQVDAIFVTGSTNRFEQAGLHVLPLERLRMVNGPTLTTTLTALERKGRLGERLVKALVMGIHFARPRRQETEKILEGLRQREPEASARYESAAKLL